MKKFNLIVFDFDGTITKKDTLIDFLIYNFGVLLFITKTISVIHYLILFVLGIIPNYIAKEKLFSVFFKGMAFDHFNRICEAYSLEYIDRITRKDAINRILWHKNNGDILIVISASIDNWIRPWAIKNGFHEVISTIPEVKNGVLTGKFQSRNCYGEEKVNALLKRYPNRKDYYLVVYGDSKGDIELLTIADKSFYKCF